MAEYIVKIIRAAFREMQKLSHEHSEIIAEVIQKISRGNRGKYRKLQGYQDLWRTRKNDLRVIWTWMDSKTVLVLKVGQRNDVYQGVIKDRDRSNLLSLSDFLNIEETEIKNIPTYEWNDSNSSSWYQFVYGGYLYSPVLTEEQRKIFNELGNQSTNYSQNRNEFLSFLLQSSPGTGKTICAALIACELYHNYNCNVNLILPKALCKEVKEFTKLKQILQQEHDNFFVGTFREWFKQVKPELYAKVASLSEELEALEKKARQIHLINNNQTLSFHDLTLYKGYVYQTSEFATEKSPIYLENKERINQLSRIRPDQWQENLKDKITWLDGLEELTKQIDPLYKNDENNTTLFIFDEAQDYFLSELKFIIEMLNRWKKECDHSTILFLLGDMNQRIQPVDFNWGHLELNKRHTLQYNYRNTEKILEFANIFHNLAKTINQSFCLRDLPNPCSPSDAFEKGEPIKLLICSSKDEAFQFLEQLNQKIRYLSDSNERSLLRLLSSKVSLIHTGISENHRNLKGINYLSVEQAKGREFDACIAFCVFDGEGQPSFQETNNWYTIFTRPRHRLLVIATSSEITRIGQEFFKQCESYEISKTDELIDWITEWSNSEHLFRDGDAIRNLIYEGLNAQPIKIYWDTYAALRLAQFEAVQINKIETQIIKALKNKTELLIEELEQIQGISSISDRTLLKCLILRSLNRSWQAVNEASQLQSVNPYEHHRLLNVIADELDNKELIYEALRVKTKIGLPLPKEFPFSENLTENTNSLVSLLCHAAINKISSKLT